jgi:hypothetical protein
MEQWTTEHRAFIAGTRFKTGDCYPVHFIVGHHGKVLSRNIIFFGLQTLDRLARQ